MKERPLIMLSNDDGIDSPGIQAAAAALLPIAEVLIAAPAEQQSATGRSYRVQKDAVFQERTLNINDRNGKPLKGWCLDASPASTVNHALQCLIEARKPDLLVSGINFGENIGTDVTASGTVGAALQAAIWGYKAIAVSLEVGYEYHLGDKKPDWDWSQAQAVLREAVEKYIELKWPADVDVIKVDIPDNANENTPWRLCRQARQPGWSSIIENGNQFSSVNEAQPQRRPLTSNNWGENTDCEAIAEKKVVAITPLSLDLSSRVKPAELEELLDLQKG